MSYIDPSNGFINYQLIDNEDSLNKILSNKIDKSYNKTNFMKKFIKTYIEDVFYNNDENIFYFKRDFVCTEDVDKLFSQFLSFIVPYEVFRFFTNSRFLEKFYKNYAKIYYSKMASTVRNYTVESLSLKSSIFPFETAFTDFINEYNEFDDIVNKITLNVLNLCTKRFVSFNHYISGITEFKKCDISIYDLFFRPNYVSKKLHKMLSINKEFKFDKVPSHIIIDDINYNALKYRIKHKTFNEIDLKEYDIKASSLVYTFIKRSIRYVFIEQMKQAFGWYLDKNKEKYSEIKSIISDTNLYYTQNIINIKQNIKYLRHIITFCDSILGIKRNKKTIMNKSDNIESFTQYVRSIIEHMRSYNDVDMKIMDELKNLYTVCFNRNPSQTVVYNTEMYKTLKSISEYFYIRNETSLTNVQNYNFIDRWNEVIDNDSIINPINYIEYKIIKEF